MRVEFIEHELSTKGRNNKVFWHRLVHGTVICRSRIGVKAADPTIKATVRTRRGGLSLFG